MSPEEIRQDDAEIAVLASSAGDDPEPCRLRCREQREGKRVAQATADTHIANAMKVRLKIADREITATLIDSETTRDFVSLLPLTLTMNDLFGREKFGHLPRAISEGGKRTRTYEVGDVIYWSPGPDVAIFYRHDGSRFLRPASSSWARSIPVWTR